MFADDLAAAQGREADGARLAWASLAVSPALMNGSLAPAVRHGIAYGKRGTGWRVDLPAMMHLQDLGIVAGRGQGGSHSSGQLEHQRDAR